MNPPDCIRCICAEYRDLLRSYAAMARALEIEEEIARAMVEGRLYPALEVMIRIQAGLRKAALLKEGDRDWRR